VRVDGAGPGHSFRQRLKNQRFLQKSRKSVGFVGSPKINRLNLKFLK
jgi:hypothetical protein